MRQTLSALVIFLCHFSVDARTFTKPSQFDQETASLKAIVFLSAFCPCSQSHIDHLNLLESEYPELKIYGVITDHPDEQEKIKQYYTKERFQFPIIEDREQVLVQKYRALKTPHVVLLKSNPKGEFEKLYEGGVTDQRQFAQSKYKYLAENLTALKNGNKPPHKQGRSLGCYIRRF